MCVKLLLGDLNLGPYLSHPTNIYTRRVTIALRVCSDTNVLKTLVYKLFLETFY